MTISAARRQAIRRRLLTWYDAGHRELPWRYPQQSADPYRVWLAEVMLQQTQVETVKPYYLRFVARWPSLRALASAREEEVLAAWSGLGYYARCRNLVAAAREMWRRYRGIPPSFEALLALPGFGRYTAGAVASIAFSLPEPVVDGNVARVLARLFGLRGDPASLRVKKKIWGTASELVPASRPGDFNQSLMELGATLCRPRQPSCTQCPVHELCITRKKGLQERVPPPRRRTPRPLLRIACAVVERDGRLLLTRREGRGLFGGLWELPSVEVEGGRDARALLASALRQRLGLSVSVGELAAKRRRELTHRRLELEAYLCEPSGSLPGNRGRLRWVARDQVGRAGLPTAIRRLWEAVGLPGIVAISVRAAAKDLSLKRIAPITQERLTSIDQPV